MEEEEDDDIYAAEKATVSTGNRTSASDPVKIEGMARGEEDEEEGEELEEDESDSDIDIITERKGDPKPEPAQSSRVNAIKTQIPERRPSTDLTSTRKESPATKTETAGNEISVRPGSSYPPVKTSNIDVDFKPIYESTGKPITDIDMDADFPEDDKPWRRPGTDMTDYFNYGFDEFTWASYCLKQQTLRKEVTDSKRQMEEMQSFLGMPGGMPPIPGMSGQTGGAQAGMAPTGGPADIPTEMQQIMSQMMAQGIDPSQMDSSTFFQMMQGVQGGAGDSGQNYGGQGYGQQGNQQQMGYGFGGGAGGGGGRNQGSRGRGHRW